jgi:hypothetical protein
MDQTKGANVRHAHRLKPTLHYAVRQQSGSGDRIALGITGGCGRVIVDVPAECDSLGNSRP